MPQISLKQCHINHIKCPGDIAPYEMRQVGGGVGRWGEWQGEGLLQRA